MEGNTSNDALNGRAHLAQVQTSDQQRTNKAKAIAAMGMVGSDSGGYLVDKFTFNKTCILCDEPVKERRSKTKYCSRKCAGIARSAQRRLDFWNKVNKTETCWLWTGARNKFGYGQVHFSSLNESKAHRVSYILTYGEIPEGLWILHKCDNPTCVRPDHLFLGNNQDNVDDKMAKGRHEPSVLRGTKNPGVKLTEAQVIEIIEECRKNNIPRKKVAQKYNVTPETIGNIVRRKYWRHLNV